MAIAVFLSSCAAESAGVEVAPPYKALSVVSQKEPPWSWWEAHARDGIVLRAEFDFSKKLVSRRRPLAFKGILLFERDGDERRVRLDIRRLDGTPDNTVLIDDSRFWTLTHGNPPVLDKIDLTQRGDLRGALQSLVLFFASTREELSKTFEIAVTRTPTPDQTHWSFRLTPRSLEDRKALRYAEVSLQREVLETVTFHLPAEGEWMRFSMPGLHAVDKKPDFTLDLPQGTVIRKIEDDQPLEQE